MFSNYVKTMKNSGLRATPALVAYRPTGPKINKKLNQTKRPHAVIPVFSRLMTRARSVTVHARKIPESRFEGAGCLYALWIPVFFGRDGEGCVRHLC